MTALGLETANPTQGFELIPDGTLVPLVMSLKAGTVGIENLLKRTAKGDAEMLEVEYGIQAGPYKGRKIFDNLLLDGTTPGHAKAGEISRAKLRAIYEATEGIDPNDNSPATVARRANATLASFHGRAFLATVAIEKGGKRAEGGNYKDKNALSRILRVGDKDYRKLDQPPPAPIDRPQSGAATAFGAAPAAPAATAPAIQKPHWAE